MRKSISSKKPLSRQTILADLEVLYLQALACENLAVALKIKELQGKALGLFTSAQLPTIDLKNLTDEELDRLLQNNL